MAKSTKSAKKKIKLDMWVLAENLNIFHHTNASINTLIRSNTDIPPKLIKFYAEIFNNENEISEEMYYEAMFSNILPKYRKYAIDENKCAKAVFEHLNLFCNWKERVNEINHIKVIKEKDGIEMFEVLLKISKKLKLPHKIPTKLNSTQKRIIFSKVYKVVSSSFKVNDYEYKEIEQDTELLNFSSEPYTQVPDWIIKIITCLVIRNHYFKIVFHEPEYAEKYIKIAEDYLKTSKERIKISEKKKGKALNKNEKK